MGQLIFLTDHAGRKRARRAAALGSPGRGQAHGAERVADVPVPPAAGARPSFFLDLGCPFSYFAAERLERWLGDANWLALDARALGGGTVRDAAWRSAAEARAAELRLPLSWPPLPLDTLAAHRVAAVAAAGGAGFRFALAAARLAFCGGFDLGRPGALAEAGAAAGMSRSLTLAAARDPALDDPALAGAALLRAAGVRQLPALCLEDRWLCGERELAAAFPWRSARSAS
jgi:2-hydroxychromene-2-carboxylate isomerase